MSNTKFFNDAVAEAKEIRETALANAKLALEEAFTPQIQSMLEKKLQEESEDLDEEKAKDDMDEAKDNTDENTVKEDARTDAEEEGYKDGMRDEKEDLKDKSKKKKVRKETVDSKLAEIEKAGRITTLEAQIEALHELIETKNQRISMVTEDDNLSELVDKKKMKEMQREVKILEKKKAGMEKMYEKLSGKSYKMDMPSGLVAQVDETEEVTEDFDDVVDDIMKQGKSKKEAEKIAGAINAKYVGNYRNE